MRFDATRVFWEELDSRSIFAVDAISLTGILLLSINGLSKRARPLPRVRFSLEMVSPGGREDRPSCTSECIQHLTRCCLLSIATAMPAAFKGIKLLIYLENSSSARNGGHWFASTAAPRCPKLNRDQGAFPRKTVVQELAAEVAHLVFC